jgi:hypothetical protein
MKKKRNLAGTRRTTSKRLFEDRLCIVSPVVAD